MTLSNIWLALLLLSLCVSSSIYLLRSEGARHALNRLRLVSLSDMLATWTFPAAILLPVPLAASIVVIASFFQWPVRNFDGKATLYRYVYSQSAVVISIWAAHAIIARPDPYLLDLILAALAYMFVGAAMVALAIASAGSFRDMITFIKSSNQKNELITVGIGTAVVLLWNAHVPLIWLSLPTVIAIQRLALRAESSRKLEAAPAPIMTEKVWGTIAREVVRACTTASIIRVDTDDPAAARSIAEMQAGCDAIGAVGDSGLVVLLADCPGPNAESLALRLRSALTGAKVSAHVAVAAKPRDGQLLEDLLAVTEAELITRDAASRSARSFRPEA